MDRRGIVLENLVGIILAIAGAVLLSFIAAGIYAYIFGGDPIPLNTRQSVQELVTYAETWRKSTNSFESTFVPWEVEAPMVLVAFSKGDQEVRGWEGGVITRPQFRQCKDRTCVCVFTPSNEGLSDPETYKLMNVLRCWELRGVDRIVSPLLHKPKFPFAVGYTQLGELMKLGASSFSIRSLGASTRVPEEYIIDYGLQTLASGVMQVEFGSLILEGRPHYSVPEVEPEVQERGPQEIYIDATRLSTGETIWYLSDARDPTVSTRHAAYVRNRPSQ